MPSDT